MSIKITGAPCCWGVDNVKTADQGGVWVEYR
jgi:hypothetical protein